MDHHIDSPKLRCQSAEFADSGIGFGDHDLIHSKIQRVYLGKLCDRQHGHPGIELARLAKEKRRNDRVAQLGIPSRDKYVQDSFRGSGRKRPVSQ
ncbi:hypothetical protein T266_18135 [Pseudomonas aeruginosa VRFPA05]|nr:hypothetical protein T266_18135 [Pseudomonas aeruginosa VRFPA05]